ncbi:helix-turn-helix domain-containing protein [Microlunatus capsulatus]|nr:helix-turn-helix transcriptional regulator [Microlunatus capsulatus]
MVSSAPRSGKTGSTVLAQLIRNRRQQLGMSRQDLADVTGVPYSTVAQIETAYRGLSPGRLGVIARALQLDPADLYDVLASEPSPTSTRAEGTRPSQAAGRDDDSWYTNPAYLAATRAPEAAAPSGPPAVPALPESDIVSRAVELLSQLPAGRRLEALGKVQARLLSDLVQHEAQRITHPDYQ